VVSQSKVPEVVAMRILTDTAPGQIHASPQSRFRNGSEAGSDVTRT